VIYHQICEHGKSTISGGKKTHACSACDKHSSNDAFFVPDTREFFNQGLGCMTAGTRDAEKKAKRMGLQPVGDAKPSDFKRRDNFNIDSIISEGVQKVRALEAKGVI